jgi:predicted RNA-binding protein with TRAM domain
MGSITNFLEVALLDHTYNNTAYTPAANLFLALATANPGEGATGAAMSEVADANGYSRKAITFGAAASRAIANSAAVEFDPASGAWGTVTHWAVVDSGTHGAGNVLAYGSVVPSKEIASGNEPSVAIGEVEISFQAGGISNFLADTWLDFAFRNQAFTSPTSTFAGWATVNLTDASTGSTVTEPAASYARQEVNPSGGTAPTWAAATSGDPTFVDNVHDIEFPAATGSQGTITAAFIASAATEGNIFHYDSGVTEQVVGEDDVVVFGATNWRLEIDQPV